MRVPFSFARTSAQVIEPATTSSAPAIERAFSPSAGTSARPERSTAHIAPIVNSGAVAITAETRDMSQWYSASPNEP